MSIKNYDRRDHFGIRKLTTGAASVLLATTFLMSGQNNTVHADTVDDNANHDQAENHENLPENDTKDFATTSDVQQSQDEQQTDAQNKNINDTDEQQKASVKTEAQTMSVKVHYTDQTGKEVASETVTGKQGDPINFTLPKGYQAINQETLKQTFDSQLEITIPVKNIKQQVKTVQEKTDAKTNKPDSNVQNQSKTQKNEQIENKTIKTDANHPQSKNEEIDSMASQSKIAGKFNSETSNSKKNTADNSINTTSFTIDPRANFSSVATNNAELNDANQTNIAKPNSETTEQAVMQRAINDQKQSETKMRLESKTQAEIDEANNHFVDPSSHVNIQAMPQLDPSLFMTSFMAVDPNANYSGNHTVDPNANHASTGSGVVDPGANHQDPNDPLIQISNLQVERYINRYGSNHQNQWHVKGHFKSANPEALIGHTFYITDKFARDNNLQHTSFSEDVTSFNISDHGHKFGQITSSDNRSTAYNLTDFVFDDTDYLHNKAQVDFDFDIITGGFVFYADSDDYQNVTVADQLDFVSQDDKYSTKLWSGNATYSSWLRWSDEIHNLKSVKNHHDEDIYGVLVPDSNLHESLEFNADNTYKVDDFKTALPLEAKDFDKNQTFKMFIPKSLVASKDDISVDLDTILYANNGQYGTKHYFHNPFNVNGHTFYTDQTQETFGDKDVSSNDFDLQKNISEDANNYIVTVSVKYLKDVNNLYVRYENLIPLTVSYKPSASAFNLEWCYDASSRKNATYILYDGITAVRKLTFNDLDKALSKQAFQDIHKIHTIKLVDNKQVQDVYYYDYTKQHHPNHTEFGIDNASFTIISASSKGMPGKGNITFIDSNTKEVVHTIPFSGVVGEKDGQIDVEAAKDWLADHNLILNEGYMIPPKVAITDVQMPDIDIYVHGKEQTYNITFINDQTGEEVGKYSVTGSPGTRQNAKLNIPTDLMLKSENPVSVSEHTAEDGMSKKETSDSITPTSFTRTVDQDGIKDLQIDLVNQKLSYFIDGNAGNVIVHLTNRYQYNTDTIKHQFTIYQQVPAPQLDPTKYADENGQTRTEKLNWTMTIHRPETTDLVDKYTSYGDWVVDHYYAYDSQGNMNDLGQATYSKNPETGEWGFWDVWNKNNDNGQPYQIDSHELITPYGKGVIYLPGYDIQNSNANAKFDTSADESWYVLNINSPEDLDKLRNGVSTATISYTPQLNHNVLKWQIDGQNNEAQFVEPDAKAIKTDSTGAISMSDLQLIQSYADSYNNLNKNMYIDSVDVGDNHLTFNQTNDGNWIINSSEWGTFTADQFASLARKNHWNIQEITLQGKSSDNQVKVGLGSIFVVADQNVKQDGIWKTDIPTIKFNLKKVNNNNVPNYEDGSRITHHYMIHYEIPAQISSDVGIADGNDEYTLDIYKTYQTKHHEDLQPTYKQEINYIYGSDGTTIIGYTTTLVPDYDNMQDMGWDYQVFDSWQDMDSDSGNPNESTLGIDDVQEGTEDAMPLVYDESSSPKELLGYKIKVYAKDANGNEIDLTDGSHLVNIGTKHYFAPYYGRGITATDEDLTGASFEDSAIGDDIYVTYVPQPAKREIIYRDIRDYPDVDDGKEINRYSVTGLEGSQTTLDYEKNVPKGYTIDDDQGLPNNAYTFNWEDDHEPVVIYIHVNENAVSDQTAFKRTITIINHSNNQASLTWNGSSQPAIVANANDQASVSGTLGFKYAGSVNPITHEQGGTWSFTSPESINTVYQLGIDTNSKSDDDVKTFIGHLNIPNGYYAYLNNDPEYSITELPSEDFTHTSKDDNIVITIAPVDQQNKVIYVDQRTNQEINPDDEQILNGEYGDKHQIDLTIPSGYYLSSNQTDPNLQITSSSDDNPQAIVTLNKSGQITVYVLQQDVFVSHRDPKTPDDIMPGFDDTDPGANYPSGVDNQSLNSSVKRIIRINEPSGSHNEIQTVNFYRNAIVHVADHSITYVNDSRTPLQGDGNKYGDGWARDGSDHYGMFIAPAVEGYTAVAKLIKGDAQEVQNNMIPQWTPHYGDTDSLIEIDYIKNTGKKTLVLVDDDASMRELERYHDNTFASASIPVGYRLATADDEMKFDAIKAGNFDQIASQNTTGNPDLVTVHLVENLKDVSNTDPKAKVNVQRRVVINNPDGTHDTVTIKVNLARTAMYNEATKSTSYGTWHIESAPITVYDHTRDNGEDEDSGFITGDLLKGALNGDIAKYVHNGGQVLANRNGVTIMQIPQIDIPDQTGYAREIDNANTDGINLSNEFIPAEDIIVADSDKQLEEMGTETNSMPVINVDNRNFDGELDKTIVVHYVKGQKEMTYRYVDRQSGRVISGDSLIGEPGQTVEINNTIPNGYHLANGQVNFNSTYTFGNANNVTKTVYIVKNTYVSISM